MISEELSYKYLYLCLDTFEYTELEPDIEFSDFCILVSINEGLRIYYDAFTPDITILFSGNNWHVVKGEGRRERLGRLIGYSGFGGLSGLRGCIRNE